MIDRHLIRSKVKAAINGETSKQNQQNEATEKKATAPYER